MRMCTFPLYLAIVLGCSVLPTEGVIREYFIAAQEIEWNYAPSGKDLIVSGAQSDSNIFLKHGADRIGSVYWKAVYKQYTDITFKTEVPNPPWLGFIGPILKAEVSDTIVVNFRNNASREYSIHPHGLFYDKLNEGAFYMDGTSGVEKMDDIVMPGSLQRYVWNMTNSMAPSDKDQNCLPWVYHSHITTQHDTSAGMLGLIVTCKKGILNSQGNRLDVDREFALLFKVFDESMSWLMGRNLERCGNPEICRQLSESEDEDFLESNTMHAINGYLFANLPGLDVCEGDRIAWYIVGMGNEVDLHNVYFSGQTLRYDHKSGDTVPAYAASFQSALMTAVSPNKWIISCMTNDHIQAGMAAYLNVSDCGRKQGAGHTNPGTDQGATRWYYLAIQEEEWDYAPSGFDKYRGGKLTETEKPSAKFFTRSTNRIGGRYKKARYHQFEDITFHKQVRSDRSDLGILGPVLRAEIGDTVVAVLHNNASRHYSINLHGTTYRSDFLAIPAGIQPGATHIHRFFVPPDFLQQDDPDCVVQLYYSEVDRVRDSNSGLVGPFVICKKGHLDSPATHPQNVTDKEFFLLFTIFDENQSWYLDDNIHTYTLDPASVDKDDADFQESNLMSSINGRMFGNLDGLNMCLGDMVTWHVMAMGSESDVHGAYFHGNTFEVTGTTRDRQDLIPGSTASLQMQPDNPGRWAILSETHIMQGSGVEAVYDVEFCSAGNKSPPEETGINRNYLIAAEEVDWDFAPEERELITGRDLNDPRGEANIFVRDDDNFIGDTYRKVVFREYTDISFNTQKARGSEDIHLGILGPIIKAEVGDVIEIVFKNKASRPFSMHSHGLLYDKSSEGANYKNDVYLEDNKGVPPGGMHIYRWHVPIRAGPGPADPNCIPWLYYSAVDGVRDVESGLVGPVVICRKGTLTASGRRKDVDREFALLFAVLNENLSWYLEQNIRTRAPSRVGTNYMQDGDFEESNKMHSINGEIMGNNKGLVMYVNQTVVWYLLSIGAEIDVHTVHLHGHTYLESSDFNHRNDVSVMFPGNAKAIFMTTDNPGTWVLHCHVLDHIQAGMETAYTVLDGKPPPMTTQNPDEIAFG